MPLRQASTIFQPLETLVFMKKQAEEKTQTESVSATRAEPAANEAVVAAETPALTTEQLEDLKARAAKADENWERYVRNVADFDNFKKRAARERQDAARFANESLLQKLIPVLDNFEMALAAAQSGSNATAQSLTAGVAMIQQQLKAALVEFGVEEVDAAGKPFDPMVHEAVSQQESADVPEGCVLQQLRKGYKLRERLLRPATVVVAKAPASAAQS